MRFLIIFQKSLFTISSTFSIAMNYCIVLNDIKQWEKALKIGIVPQELEAKSPWKMGTVLEELNAKKVCGK